MVSFMSPSQGTLATAACTTGGLLAYQSPILPASLPGQRMPSVAASGDTAVLRVTELTCLWLRATLSQARETRGVVAKRLFVSKLDRSLAIFGRLLIGNRSITATAISVVAAPRSLTRRERRLRNWCSRWAKMAWPTCLTATAWGALPRRWLQKVFLVLSEGSQQRLTTRAREPILFFILKTTLLQLIKLLPRIRLP